MIRFYSPDIETVLQLPEVESGHCCRVLRMKKGDFIEVVDGRGNVYSCQIKDPDPRHTSVEIIESYKEKLHWTPRITLAVAPTKNIDRMEWLAEKVVEIGLNRLVFLECRHSVRKVVKRDRISKILISAMKQSLKATLPEFVEMIPISEFVKKDTSSCKFIGYCDECVPRKDFATAYDGRSDITILIGPEGDFSPEEISLCLEYGYHPVTFGNTRLRTETAALFSLCAAHTIILQH